MLKPSTCSGCYLQNISNGFVQSEGNGTNNVLILGEAAGFEEYLDALPFRPKAQAGSKLEEVFKLISNDLNKPISRGQFFLYNVVNCNPPHDKLAGTSYEQTVIDFCTSRYLDNFVSSHNIKCIVALGNIPLKYCTSVSGIADLKESISHLRGYVMESRYGIPCIPSYHPSFLKRGNGHLTPFLIEDIKKALKVATGEYTSYSSHSSFKSPKYIEYPSVGEFESYYKFLKQNENLVISHDIETTFSATVEEDERESLDDVLEEGTDLIEQVQFSHGKKFGLAVPFTRDYIDIIRNIYRLSNTKIGFNSWNFDRPRLLSVDIPINGIHHDLMWCLRADTRIKDTFGYAYTIKEIVENKLPLEIWGMNEQGKRVKTNVIDWHKKKVENQSWVKIKCSNSKSWMILTPDHKVWSNNTWILAENLNRGDDIKGYKIGSDDLIHGTLLGDGTVNRGNVLSISHGVNQLEYIQAKARHLGTVVNKSSDTRTEWYYIQRTVCSSWRNKFYSKNGLKKFIPPISNKALAIWYMDDWGWYIVNKKHKEGYIKTTIAGFEDNYKAVEWLEQLVGKEYVHWKNGLLTSDGRECIRITIKKGGMHKFFSLINTFIIPTMYYKLPEYYRSHYNNWLDEEIPENIYVTNIIYNHKSRQHSNRIRYCITVDEPTHRFFTEAGLVSNCFKHFHPRLERGLQKVSNLFDFPFPWKHLFGSKLAWYGCADVDAPHWIYSKLPQLMKARGVWNGYERQVRGIYNILTDASEVRGIPVNEEKRLNLKSEFEVIRKDLNESINRDVPDDCKNLTPRRKDKNTGFVSYGYIREPREIQSAKFEYARVKTLLEIQKRGTVSFRRFVKRKYGLVLREFKDIDKKSGQIVDVTRWCNLEEFNSGSSPQVIQYLKYKQRSLNSQAKEIKQGIRPGSKKDATELEKLAKEYEVPISLKTKKETTAGDELEEIYYNTGDSVIEAIIKDRSVKTNLNNFVPNWKPDSSGRTRCEWNFGPPSGQLATRRPNSQNVSKHTEFGQLFRGIIEAPEGYVFVELDKKSFHVATMGYAANDATYIRFSQLDPHSIFTSFVLPEFKPVDFNWSDSDILIYCKEIKSWCKKQREKDPTHGVNFRQDCAKPVVLGNQLGLGPIKLQRQNRRYIADVPFAKRLQSIIADRFPKVTNFKDYIREKAWRQNYILNEFNRIQYFYDIFSFRYNKKRLDWDRGAGSEYNEPVGFSVQSIAFGMITEELITCNNLGYCDIYNFIMTIHDSLIFMPKIRDLEKCINDVTEVMNRPCKQLVNEATGPKGLVVKVESSWGRNWRNYDEVNNKEGMREYVI